jgi:DNA-binding Lrp family transcriptional regulator
LRSFLLVKTKPGLEQEILGRFKAMPEVREIHLITGKFDLLVTMESEETDLDPRKKVVELVVERVRKAGGIIDTRTIIPITSQTRPPTSVDRPTVKAFVFIQSEAGKEKDLMSRLLQIPEVTGVHLLFGKADLLTELNAEKSVIHPPPQHIANLVQTKISKLSGVHDTDTYVPLESIMKNQ